MTIVSKDSDFRLPAFLDDPPPKAVWLRVDNAATAQIVTLLLDEHERIIEFGEETLLVLVPRESGEPGR